MRFTRLVIGRKVVDKIWKKHRLTPEQVREAFEGASIRRGPASRQGGRTYICRGRTYAGERLWILVRVRRHGVAVLITAYQDQGRKK